MARRQKVREVAHDVQEVRQTIDSALNRGVVIPYDGEDTSMNNDEVIVPAATENVAVTQEATEAQAEASETPAAPDVDVVVQRDSTPAEQLAREAHAEEDKVNLSDTDELRRFSADELREAGVPSSSIPRNAASTAPDLDPEKARELERRAAESPSRAYAEGGEGDTSTDSGAGEGQAVG